LAAVLAVALVATIAVITVVHFTRDNSPPKRVDGLLAGTYPQKPTAAWTVSASSLGASRMWDPDTQAAVYSNVGFIDAGDQIVVRVLDQKASGPRLVALDSQTGKKNWSLRSDQFTGCAAHPVGRVLPCLIDRQVRFIRLSDGSVASSYAPDFRAVDLTSDGHTVIVAGYREVGDQPDWDTMVVVSGTVNNPEANWKKIIDVAGCSFGSGDYQDVVAKDGFVDISFGSNAGLRLSNGSPLIERGQIMAIYPGLGATARRCAEAQAGGYRGSYFDEGGRKLRAGEFPLRPLLWVTAKSAPPVLMADGDAVDFATGARQWSKSDLDGKTTTFSVIGDEIVYFNSGAMEAYDIATGRTRWSKPVVGQGWTPALTDGVRLIGFQEGTVMARSLVDGSDVWSMQTNGAYPTVGAAEDGIVVVTEKSISLYPPTGRPSHVPSDIGSAAQSEQDNQSTGSHYVTKCGSPPKFSVVNSRNEQAGLVATLRITATCPGGDVLSSSNTRISLAENDGTNIASGVFDMSKDTVYVPRPDDNSSDGHVDRDFWFGPDSYWLPISTMGGKYSGSTSGGSGGMQDILVECEQSGSSSTTSGSPPTSGNDDLVKAAGPARPISGDPEAAAFDALRAIADADMPAITSDLAERWVPQLSSKRIGLVADGITWNNSETLREHLDLRARYPHVRLLWSGDWSVFSDPDFWVTVAGVTFTNPSDTLRWCTSNGFDRDHCYAKLISKTHPIEGSTELLPG
jgi:hypothetical protein